MNNTFNIQRFGLLLKRQWLEFGKIYLITLVVVIGVTIAFYGVNVLPLERFRGVGHNLGFREPFFFIFGFLFITVIASNYFAHLGQKPKAVIDLMIPASTFEKFFVGILFTTLLSTISFVSIFYICDFAFVSYIKANLPQVDTSEIQYFFKKTHTIAMGFKPTYIIPFFTTSVFLLGSIYFNKFHYIKTAISVMIFSGIWAAIVFKSGKLLFDGTIMIHEENRNSVNVSQSSAEWLGILLLAAVTLIFWRIAYVRLKEKQV